MDLYTFPPLLNTLAGYLVSIVLGGLVIDYAVEMLRKNSTVIQSSTKPDMYLVRWLGALERFFYTTCILLGQPSGIAAWLAIKVLTRWTNQKEKEGWESISKSNIYLIGNLLTVLFGAAGGLVCLILPK